MCVASAHCDAGIKACIVSTAQTISCIVCIRKPMLARFRLGKLEKKAYSVCCGYWNHISVSWLPCFPGQGGRGIGSVPLSFPSLPPCQRHWFGACLGIMVSLCVCVWGACWAGVRHVGSMPFALSVPNAVAGTLYTIATFGLCGSSKNSRESGFQEIFAFFRK